MDGKRYTGSEDEQGDGSEVDGWGRKVALTTASSTGSSALVSSPRSSPTAGAAAAGGSSAFGSGGGACSDSALDCLFGEKIKHVNR